MAFSIHHKITKAILFTAAIETNELAHAVQWAMKNHKSLRGANLSGADLSYTDLRGADLRGADLSYTDLRGADLRGADLRGADLSSADLRSADLSYTDLSGADLSSANLRSADLSYTDLRGADLSSANILVVQNIGSEAGTLIATWDDKECVVTRGCFKGSLEEFKQAVKDKHEGTKYFDEYMCVCKLIEMKYV